MIKRSSLHYPKRGSVILVVACVIVTLLLLLSSFIKSTTSRMYATKKLSDSISAREFASSLAILVTNYIKKIELKKQAEYSNGKPQNLKAYLELPLDDLKSLGDVEKDITDDFKSTIQAAYNDDIISLLSQNSGLNFSGKKWSVSWALKKDEFLDIPVGKEVPHPREKNGIIRLKISIDHIPPAQKNSKEEIFEFYSNIKVVANLLPVLSKFTFYVEDAMVGEGSDEKASYNKFNVLKTQEDGNISNDATIYPWVFNNGTTDTTKQKYDDIVEDSRGLIYLGGATNDNPIKLGLSCGWADNGNCGEDFHFFMNDPKGEEGYWKTMENWGNNDGIMVSEIGFCSATGGDYKEWRDQLSNEHQTLSRRSSIFKLYGTDGDKSPTLVLGYVNSLFASIKIYKFSGDSFESLPYLDEDKRSKFFIYMNNAETNEEAQLLINHNGDEGYNSLNNFSNGYKNKKGESLDYDKYIAGNFISGLSHQRYNKDLTYIVTNNKVDYPLDSNASNFDQNLKDLCGSNENAIFCKVPTTNNAKYGNIYSGADLKSLDTFLDVENLGISGSTDGGNRSRLSYIIKPQKEKDFQNDLKNKGYFNNSELDINGWLYVRPVDSQGNETTMELTLPPEEKKCNNKSQGGIIHSNGNIQIKADITGNHLTIIALNGDIVIDQSVQKLNASLIAANGIVKLDGNPSATNKLEITDNIVIKKIEKDTVKNNMKRGLYLTYNNDLSAKPYTDQTKNGESELNLLMFDYQGTAKLFD